MRGLFCGLGLRLESNPYADTLLWTFTEQGQLGSRILRRAGAIRGDAFPTYGATGDLTDRLFTAGAPGYTAMAYDRNGGLGDDVGSMGPALGPGWHEQHTAGTVTDSLRDAPITYDGWERLGGWTEKHYTGATLADSVTIGYSYDQNGNVRQHGGPGRTTETYDSNDRLTSDWEGATDWTYGYDAAGNLASAASSALGVTRAYSYDALNRLVTVRQDGVLIARYGYDVLGRRIGRRVYSHITGGATGYTRYIYAGQQVEYEADSAGSRTLKYLWGPGTDNLAMVRTAADSAYQVVTDQLGSVRMLVGADSAAAWRASWRYDPYGNLIDSSGSSPVTNFPYRWTGREYDAETGFYYLRARYYDPQAKRFTQEDPIGYSGGSNLYGYVDGHVLEARDPAGLETCWTTTIVRRWYGVYDHQVHETQVFWFDLCAEPSPEDVNYAHGGGGSGAGGPQGEGGPAQPNPEQRGDPLCDALRSNAQFRSDVATVDAAAQYWAGKHGGGDWEVGLPVDASFNPTGALRFGSTQGHTDMRPLPPGTVYLIHNHGNDLGLSGYVHVGSNFDGCGKVETPSEVVTSMADCGDDAGDANGKIDTADARIEGVIAFHGRFIWVGLRGERFQHFKTRDNKGSKCSL